jgi:hypothetical protein
MAYTSACVGDGITDDTATLQSEVSSRRLVIIPPGRTIKITSPITLPAGTSLIGSGGYAQGPASKIVRPGTDQSYLVLGNGCRIAGLMLDRSDTSIPASGAVIACGSYTRLEDIWIEHCYDGVKMDGGGVDTSAPAYKVALIARDLHVKRWQNAGLNLGGGANSVQIDSFEITNFTDDNSSVAPFGTAILLREMMEGVVMTKGDVIGGQYGLRTTAATFTRGQCPAFNSFTDVLFDTSALHTVYLYRALSHRFSGCWAAASAAGSTGNCVHLDASDDSSFVNCNLAAAYSGHGAYISALAKRAKFIGCTAQKNAQHGFHVQAGATDFAIVGPCTATNQTPWSYASQSYGVYVEAGASDRYRIDLQGEGGTIGRIYDGGTGTNKTIGPAF